MKKPSGSECLSKLLASYEFKTVLDIGAGGLQYLDIFKQHGKEVTRIDYGSSPLYKSAEGDIVADYNTYEFDKQFDCIWCSHVLEHQTNPGLFLNKIYRDLKVGGVLAITVPPGKGDIVGGHLTVWNQGLLLYNLVIAGFDCSEAKIKRYGYNISCLVIKRERPVISLNYDRGDLRKLKAYFPAVGIEEDSFDGKFNSPDW